MWYRLKDHWRLTNTGTLDSPKWGPREITVWPIVTTHRTGAPSHVTPPSWDGCVSSVGYEVIEGCSERIIMKAKITLLLWSCGHCLNHPFWKVMLRACHYCQKKNPNPNKQKHAKIKFNCSFSRRFYTVMSLGYKVLTDYYIKLQSNANSGHVHQLFG